jgi:hypothetical protein
VDRYPQFGRGSVPLSAKAAKPAQDGKPVAKVVKVDDGEDAPPFLD